MHQNYFNMLLGSPAIIRTYVQVPPSPPPPLHAVPHTASCRSCRTRLVAAGGAAPRGDGLEETAGPHS